MISFALKYVFLTSDQVFKFRVIFRLVASSIRKREIAYVIDQDFGRCTCSFHQMDYLGLPCHEEDDAASVGDVGQEVEGLSEQMGRLIQVEDALVESIKSNFSV